MTDETLLTGGDTTADAGDETVDTNTGNDVQVTDEAKAAAETSRQESYDALSDDDKAKYDALDDDGKAEWDKKKADEKAASESGDKDGAPESYEDFTLPEGVEINEADMTEFGEIARGLNLSQDQAQQLIDFQSKRAEAFSKGLQEAFDDQQAEWVKELKDDKDFGGDNLDKNVGLAVKVINKFGSPELKGVLDSTGMGNNPELIKLLHKIGRSISEDTLAEGDETPASGGEKDLASTLYPNQGSS